MGECISQHGGGKVLFLNRQRTPINGDRGGAGKRAIAASDRPGGAGTRRDRQGALTMKLSLGPRQLTITLNPIGANGAALAEYLHRRGIETDEDFAKLANGNLVELERARSEVAGFFSGSRRG